MSALRLPLIYTITFNYLEPIFALFGAYIALFQAENLVAIAGPNATFNPTQQYLFDQLAGSWLLLAFLDAVVLRQVTDLKTYRLILCAVLVSDAVNVWSISGERGLGLKVFCNPSLWEAKDWANILPSVGPAVVKLFFLAGVGVSEGAKQGRRRKGD